ncbi:hypothetical protein JCM6882_006518 [Rhodosporidiobolus microsporus]
MRLFAPLAVVFSLVVATLASPALTLTKRADAPSADAASSALADVASQAAASVQANTTGATFDNQTTTQSCAGFVSLHERNCSTITNTTASTECSCSEFVLGTMVSCAQGLTGNATDEAKLYAEYCQSLGLGGNVLANYFSSGAVRSLAAVTVGTVAAAVGGVALLYV